MKADSLTSKLVLSLFLSAGCSSGSGGRGGGGGQGGITQTGGGGQGGSAQAGSNGEAGGTSGQSAAGAGGSTGGAGAAGDVAGMGGASADGSAGQVGSGSDGGQDGGTAPSAGPFTCTMVLGLFTTSQWFNGTNPGGATKTFQQQPGIDATKWEGKLQKYSYVEKWADPANGVWKITTATPCATNATSPDRVLFVGFSPDTKANDQPTIQALLEKSPHQHQNDVSDRQGDRSAHDGTRSGQHDVPQQ